MYILCLVLMLIAYFALIYVMKYMKNTNVFNFLFFIVAYILYLALVIKVYCDVGFNDWNFQNTLPVANVSPFMFATLPLFYLLPRSVKKYYMLLISLLSVGMLCATVVNCVYFHSIGYAFHYHFLFDHISHLILSLMGIYFVRSNQVSFNRKNILISSSIILSVAVFMLILNVIFDTAFFGLSLTGKHNIYNNVVVDNSYLSAFIYFVGLSCVLLLGYLLMRFIKRNEMK